MSKLIKGGALLIAILSVIIVLSVWYPQLESVQDVTQDILPIVLTFGFFMSVDNYFRDQKTLRLQQEASLTEKNWVNVYEKIKAGQATCPRFCSTLAYPWQVPPELILTSVSLSALPPEDYSCVLNISIAIFQSFASVLTYYLYNDTGEPIDKWIRAFIVWSNSDMLYQVWGTIDFIYSDITRMFVDEIFKMVKESPPKNEKELNALAHNVCKSDKISYIFSLFDRKVLC